MTGSQPHQDAHPERHPGARSEHPASARSEHAAGAGPRRSGNGRRRRPVVGISTYLEPARWSHWDRAAALIPQVYIDGVTLAGGTPVLLPVPGAMPDGKDGKDGQDGADGQPGDGPESTESTESTKSTEHAERAEHAVLAVHALVLSGGADVDPARYGQAPEAATVCRPDRDAWELALLRAALAHRRPVLAICRGMQLLNVACGGTLHQHLPDTVGHEEHRPAPARFGSTRVRVAPASRLAAIVGPEIIVSCNHHQAVDRIGDGLRPVAWAADGTIEGVEQPGPGFLIGVQWHPEEDATDLRLFASLVRATADNPVG